MPPARRCCCGLLCFMPQDHWPLLGASRGSMPPAATKRPEGLPDDGPEWPLAEDPEGPPRADRERLVVGPGTSGASSSSTSLLAQLGGPP
eukprot:242404-Prorocentrum_lima.AAC.1